MLKDEAVDSLPWKGKFLGMADVDEVKNLLAQFLLKIFSYNEGNLLFHLSG